MRTRRTHYAAALIAAMSGALAMGLAACSGGDRPAATGNVSPSPTSTTGRDGGDPAEAGIDAASITPRPDLCEGLTLGGPVVAEIEHPGEAPAPAGGEITQGTYNLTAVDVYQPDGGTPDGGDGNNGADPRFTGNTAQATLTVSEFAMQTIEARGTESGGLGPATTSAVLYRVDDGSLVATPVCPETAVPERRSFTARANGLLLFPDAEHVLTYSLKP